MIAKTEGLVINYIKYRETSIIARLFTPDNGFQSFIVNSIRGKKKLGFFEPLTFLDMVYYPSKSSDLHRLSEYGIKRAHIGIRFNIKKNAVTLFLSEVLYKLLATEQTPNRALYDYLTQSISIFENETEQFENFHIQFLLKLTRYMGFGYDPDRMHLPGHSQAIDSFAKDLSQSDMISKHRASGKLRSETLEAIIKYYRTHTRRSLKVKSLDVLRQINV